MAERLYTPTQRILIGLLEGLLRGAKDCEITGLACVVERANADQELSTMEWLTGGQLSPYHTIGAMADLQRHLLQLNAERRGQE